MPHDRAGQHLTDREEPIMPKGQVELRADATFL